MILVVGRSKTWVCGRSPAGITSSNPAGGMDDMSVFNVVCCQVEISATGRSLIQRNSTECLCVCVCVTECDQVQQER